MPNPVTDVLWWINSEVDKLSGIGLARVREMLDGAQQELAADLAEAKWLGTDDRYTAQVHRNALVQIQGAIDHLNEQVAPELAQTLRSNGHAAGALATKHLAHEVASFSSIFEGTVRPIALEAASVIAQGDKLLWPRFKNSASRYAGQVGDDIRRQLAIGLVRGETIDQMTTRLARHGGPKGFVYTKGRAGDPKARAEYISEGLFKRFRSWGERLARTETVNAYNEVALIGMHELEKADPGYFKRWDAAVDGRTCIICRMFDDLVVPLDSNFPEGFDKPPRHPNCRCACVIWRKEWSEADVRDNIMSEVKRGEKLGTIQSVPHKYEIADRKERRKLEKVKELQVRKEKKQPVKLEKAKELQIRKEKKQPVKVEKDQQRELRQDARQRSKEDHENLKVVAKIKNEPLTDTVHERVKLSSIVDKKQVEVFERGCRENGFHVNFAEVSQALAPPPGYVGKVAGLFEGNIMVHYYEEKTGKHVAEIQREFWKGAELHHSYFVLDKDFQGTGFSDLINGQMMLRYEKWGVQNASVDAAWVGRYAWARLGFTFNDPAYIAERAETFIRANVVKEKQADYIAKARALVEEPWKFAKWDEGDKHKISFNSSGEGTKQTGEYAIGKAILLHSETNMWSGHIPIDSDNGGYLNALRLLKVSERQ